MATKIHDPLPRADLAYPRRLMESDRADYGTGQTTRHGQTPGHPQLRSFRRLDLSCCTTTARGRPFHATSMPQLDGAWPVPLVSETRRVSPGVADLAALL